MLPIESARSEGFLRVLMICPTQWRDDQGLPKVQMELTEELRRRGHIVDKFSLEDAATIYVPPQLADLIPLFPTMVHRFLRERGGSYDVVDAHQGTITRQKESLGFAGGLLIRSAGLHHFYSNFNRWADPHNTPGARHWIGRRREALAGELTRRAVERSFDAADRIIIHNRAELDFLRLNPNWVSRTRMVPAPISKQAFDALSQVRHPSLTENEARPVVTVVGTWDPRKGSRDWPRLAALIAAAVPGVELRFLGTSLEKAQAFASDALGECVWVPRYNPRELPHLLRGGQVGAFATYLEGSPIGVVEQLAAGIPVVAYDVPGPRDILEPVEPRLLARPGDMAGLAKQIIRVLSMDRAEAANLRSRCVARAKELTWDTWADSMVTYYAEAARMPNTPPRESCRDLTEMAMRNVGRGRSQ